MAWILLFIGFFCVLMAIVCFSYMVRRRPPQNQSNQNGLMVLPPVAQGVPPMNGQNDFEQSIQALAKTESHLQALLQVNPKLLERIQDVTDSYDYRHGIFRIWSERIFSQSRGGLVKVLTEEKIALIQEAAALEQQVNARIRSEAELKIFLRENGARLIAIEAEMLFKRKAFGEGFLPADLSQLNLEKALSDLRLQEEEARIGLDTMREEHRIKTKIKEVTEYESADDHILTDLHRKLEQAIERYEALKLDNSRSEESKEILMKTAWSQVKHYEQKIEQRQKVLDNYGGH
jgi:hypothetical protein